MATGKPAKKADKKPTRKNSRKVVASAPVAAANGKEKKKALKASAADALPTPTQESPPPIGDAPYASALDIPVAYGGVSIGKETARLGMTIDRKVLNVVGANEAFCNRRLHGRVMLGNDDGALFDKSLAVESVFDVKGFRVTSDAIGVGLTFQMNEIDIATLAKFSKGGGRLVVDEISQIPGGESKDEDFDDED